MKSVANMTRRDVAEMLTLAAQMQLKPTIQPYALAAANQALIDSKTGSDTGVRVLMVDQ